MPLPLGPRRPPPGPPTLSQPPSSLELLLSLLRASLPCFHTSLLLFRRPLLVLFRWAWPLGLTLLGGAYFWLKDPFSF